MNPRAPVPVLARVKRRADQHAQPLVALRVRRGRSSHPGMEAARRHRQGATERTDAKEGLLRCDPRKLYCWCFAKKAAAFFRISRSVRNSRFSLRSRASSSPAPRCQSRAAVGAISLGPLDPARRAVSVRSRSRAAAPTVLPRLGPGAPPALEVVVEPPTGPSALGGLCHCSRHRITFRKMSTKPTSADRKSHRCAGD